MEKAADRAKSNVDMWGVYFAFSNRSSMVYFVGLGAGFAMSGLGVDIAG